MTVILQTIDYLKSVWIGDYIQYNENKVGYVIEIIDNNNVWIWEATESWRTTMDKVNWNMIRIVSLAVGKPSLDQNIRQSPSPLKDEKRLIIKDGSDESHEFINIMKLGIKWEHSLLNKDYPFYEYLKEHQNKAKEWIHKKLPKHIDNSNKDLS